MTRFYAALACIAFVGLAAPAALADGHGGYKLEPDVVTEKYGEDRAYFRDWLASCGEGGVCSALTYIGADGDFFDASVRVRSPRPGADFELVLVGPYDGLAPNPSMTLTIDRFDPIPLEAGADLGWANEPGDAANEYRVSQSVANLTAIPQLKRGYWLTATWPRADGGEETMRFSLNGLQAALLWMDDQRAF